MSYMVNRMKSTIIQLENVSYSDTDSACIWNVITTTIGVNISFVQFKSVLKLYLHKNEVILKYSK